MTGGRRFWLNLYAPETWEDFLACGARETGVKHNAARRAARVVPGDILLGYITKRKLWGAVLEVTAPAYEAAPDQYPHDPEYRILLPIRILSIRGLDQAVPMDEHLHRFSFHDPDRPNRWGVWMRQTLREMTPEDGRLVAGLLGVEAL